jgi:ABC-2 type transport system ATP-binding protein
VAEPKADLVVETFKLTKIYQNRQIALNDVTLRLEPGCVLGLLGANGAGKTTLLRLIIGLHRPTAGWAKVFGKTMGPNSADLRRRIGYIPTNPQFPRGMTPITYLDYMARLFGLPADVRKPRLAALIRAVDLLGASGQNVSQFSNGMTARLAVATSLINEPDLLIWDEPTHGLDPEARRSMLELIKTLGREKTLIVSSHNLGDIDEVCNHAAVLSHGQLIYCGSLQDLKGRMRRNHFEIDLEGEQKAIAKATAAVRNITDFKIVTLRHRKLELFLQEEAVAATALAGVFTALNDNKVTLVGVRSVGQQTEQAFLDLVNKEESRGFARIYNGEAACSRSPQPFSRESPASAWAQALAGGSRLNKIGGREKSAWMRRISKRRSGSIAGYPTGRSFRPTSARRCAAGSTASGSS